MASVHIVTRTPTHFADPSEISPSSPNQLKLREEWYCEYFCLDRKRLQKPPKQNFETSQKIIPSPKPIIRSWFCLPLNSEFTPLCVLAPLRCHYSNFSEKLPLHFCLSAISSTLKKKKKKRNKEMHFFFWIKPLSFLREGEISIILQQDFHWLRPQICPEIPTEAEPFPFLSVCFSVLLKVLCNK